MKKLIAILTFSLCVISAFGQTDIKMSIDTDIRAIRNNDFPTFRYKYDDYLQYSPAVVTVGMKAFGYGSRTSWGRMLVSDAFSVAVMAIAVNGMKYSVRRMRPDGSRKNSFPSGHTATAFMTATMLHKEYGWKSPWFSIGGYAAASITGVSRLLNNKHWMSDIVAGAAIGTGAVHLGYFLADLIFKDKYLHEDYFKPEFFYDPAHGYYNVDLFFSRRFILNGNRDGVPDRGGIAGVSVDIPVIPRIGVCARTSANSMTSTGEGITDSYNMYNAMAGAYFNYPFARLLEAGARIMAGYGWAGKRYDGLNGAAGISLGLITGNNFKIKAFAEYELLSSIRQKPSIHSINVGYSAAFCW